MDFTFTEDQLLFQSRCGLFAARSRPSVSALAGKATRRDPGLWRQLR